MKIGLLNVRITIEKNEVVTDKYGNHKNTWVPYYSCYATASSESPKEETDAGRIVDDSKIDFTVRHCRAIDALTSTGYRVFFRDEAYNILGIDHMNFKHKAVKLICQKASRS